MNAEIQRIGGACLTSVQFVLNYLILGFGPKGALTTLVWPLIERKDSQVLEFGMEGYRNDLCALIESRVNQASVRSDETIDILFDNGWRLRIPLRSYDSPSGERAILTGPKSYLFVF